MHKHITNQPVFDQHLARRHEAMGDAFLDACLAAGVAACPVAWITERVGDRPRALLFIGIGCPETINAPTDEALVSACVRRLAQFRRNQVIN